MEIWEYKKNDETHIVKIYERKDRILVIENEGIAYFEGCEKAFNFILEHVKKTNIPALILLDNRNLHMIDNSVKMLFLRYQEANRTIKKIAALGNNSFVRQFGKLYQYTFHFDYKIRSFKNRNTAFLWLKSKESK